MGLKMSGKAGMPCGNPTSHRDSLLPILAKKAFTNKLF